MDSQHATVAGMQGPDSTELVILGHVKNPGAGRNSNENAANHEEIALTHKFFKDIAALMPNVDEIHVTGTGQVQEQFIHFLAATPQYKHAVSSESTSNKMGDEQLLAFFTKHFN
jgi:stalled ribosome rescue protein Dom34